MVDAIMPQYAHDEQEEWRPVPGQDGYEVSSLGRVRSLDRVVTFAVTAIRTKKIKGRILKLKTIYKDGKPTYHIFTAPGGKTLYVNRVACEAFNGPPPEPNYDSAHVDGNSLNNKSPNLEWATRKVNMSHKVLHGTQLAGSQIHWLALLHEDDIPKIFDAYISGLSVSDVAERYEVGIATIAQILRREHWVHVPVDAAIVAEVKRLLSLYHKDRPEFIKRSNRLR